MSTVVGRIVPTNETENGSDYFDYGYVGASEPDSATTESEAELIIDDFSDMLENGPIPHPATYTPEAAALSSGDPLKITMWVAVKSKVMSPTDREEMLSKGVVKPPLAMQKMLVVAHIDPSKTSPKTLKLYEVNAHIDPEFSQGKEEKDLKM
eukprot:GFUD01022496.1.p1 GENE.GFUD01022496.1~~GFUD01022496.1.p1  ORF type:complete len:177 (-),score=58.63 GFUD01022496.1:306-761(-)